MKRALQKSWMRPLIGLPRDFRQMLLQDPAAANGANPYREDDVLVIQTQSCSDAEQQVGGYMTMPNENICLNDENALLPLKGIPVRPFYREISKRLYVLQQQQQCTSTSNSNMNILFDAETLKMTEVQHLPTIPALPLQANMLHCALWLRSAQSSGILRLLGMRSTIGSTSTTTHTLPPDINALIAACRAPHKPNAKHPRLSVCARARSKHAHRGAVDQFFGEVRGGALLQNEVSEKIVCRLLRDAVWVNIHEFGGSAEPVLEVRVEEGYGARWSLGDDFVNDAANKVNEAVVFRGFLEPQMEDGHTRKWRH